MLSGKYVKTFAEATHALPQGMHMNANYPFMLPRIINKTDKTVTLKASRGNKEKTINIIKRNGREYCYLEQSSSFEMMYNRKPQRFKFLPFRNEAG